MKYSVRVPKTFFLEPIKELPAEISTGMLGVICMPLLKGRVNLHLLENFCSIFWSTFGPFLTKLIHYTTLHFRNNFECEDWQHLRKLAKGWVGKVEKEVRRSNNSGVEGGDAFLGYERLIYDMFCKKSLLDPNLKVEKQNIPYYINNKYLLDWCSG